MKPEPPKYRDKRTTQFASGQRIREFQAFERQAYKRLDILEAATTKNDLLKLPGNHFEALGGNRHGHSKQMRHCWFMRMLYWP